MDDWEDGNCLMQVIALFLRSNLKGTGVNNYGDIVLEDQYGQPKYPFLLL